MKTHSLTCESSGEESTARIAAALGPALSKGDVVLLEGDIGTGKTLFARRLIQSLQQCPEDVPSPSFTLVQVYKAQISGAMAEIWHADLYRLSDPAEVWELGLDDAFADAISFIEWPDRLGADCPARRIEIALAVPENGVGRDLTATFHGSGWGHVRAALRATA